MKKLFFYSLILLAVSVLLPQVSAADMIVSQEEGQEYKTVNRGSISCLRRKKEKLTGFTGKNLQLQRGKLFKEKVPSGQTYFLSSESQTPTAEESLLGNCRDYIVMGSIGEGETKISLYYDVTEIPPNSYLKYISNTQELQVFPPRNAEKQNKEEKKEEVKEGTTVDITDTLKSLREGVDKETVQKDVKEEIQVPPLPDVVKTTQVSGEDPTQQKPRKNIFVMLMFAFFFTALVEAGVALLFFGANWKFIGVLTAANLLTVPILNLIIFHYNITSNFVVFLFEIIVIFIELGIFALYMRKDYVKLSIFALLANLASYLVGAYLVNMQFWWNAINKI